MHLTYNVHLVGIKEMVDCTNARSFRILYTVFNMTNVIEGTAIAYEY